MDLKLIKRGNSKPCLGTFSIVTASRIDKNKNISSIIKAIHKLKNEDVHLKIIGDGPELINLKALSTNLCLESKITFYGRVNRERVYELLHNSKLFISMSKTEGHPVAVLEALGAGIPVILSDIEPHIEIDKDHDSVKIVDEIELVDAINLYKSKSNEDLLKISESAKNIIKEHFSLKKMTDTYFETYKRII